MSEELAKLLRRAEAQKSRQTCVDLVVAMPVTTKKAFHRACLERDVPMTKVIEMFCKMFAEGDPRALAMYDQIARSTESVVPRERPKGYSKRELDELYAAFERDRMSKEE